MNEAYTNCLAESDHRSAFRGSELSPDPRFVLTRMIE
jgi:hypothetical protein